MTEQKVGDKFGGLIKVQIVFEVWWIATGKILNRILLCCHLSFKRSTLDAILVKRDRDKR